MKKVVTIILALFLVASAAVLIIKGNRAEAAKEQPSVSPQSASGNYINVYYFFGKPRCPTCIKLEKYTRESVESAFPEELKQGSIKFTTVDMDNPANKEKLEKFKLYTKAVIVEEIKGGTSSRWKNIDKVWELLDSEAEFRMYVRDEVVSYLAEKK